MKHVTHLLGGLSLLLGLLLTGCANNGGAHDNRPDYFRRRQTVVGSNVPVQPGKVTNSPVSATAPPESLSRDQPSLYPTEPVVGASRRNADRGTNPVNVGAGPPGSNPVLPVKKSTQDNSDQGRTQKYNQGEDDNH